MKQGTIEKTVIGILAFTTVLATALLIKTLHDGHEKQETAPVAARTAATADAGHQGKQMCAAADAGVPDAITVIHQRKSVRSYVADKPVPDDMMDKLVRAGMAAPTAGNRQPWYFVTVKDPEMLKKLAETHAHTGMLAQAGAAIVVVGAPSESLRGESGQMWVQDCSAAIENILLAAEALGLGAVWLGVYPVEERVQFCRDTLKIPADFVPMSIISIGWPAGDEKPKDKYKPEKIFKESWGSR